MCLSAGEYTKILTIIDLLHRSLNSDDQFEQIAQPLLTLLDADYFSLSLWSESDGVDYFDSPTHINVSKVGNNNSKQDLSVGDQDIFLSKTCHADIRLSVNDKHHYYADMRLWRTKKKPEFTQKEHYLLKIIKPHFCNAIRNSYDYKEKWHRHKKSLALNSPYLIKKYLLTPREAEVMLAILQGKQDKVIARQLDIAFSTLRTHLKNIFSKLEVTNRSLLLNRIYLDFLLAINKA